MPCEHDSCGVVQGVKLEGFLKGEALWDARVHLCRKCGCMYAPSMVGDLGDKQYKISLTLTEPNFD